jgi:hypothetical protein
VNGQEPDAMSGYSNPPKLFKGGLVVLDVATGAVRRMAEAALSPGAYGAAAPDSAGRRLEFPDWMFEREACCGLRQAESPQADRAALEGLKSRIACAAAACDAAMIEMRHRPSPFERDADATPRSPSSRCSTGSIPTAPAEAGMARSACRSAREDDRADPAGPPVR